MTKSKNKIKRWTSEEVNFIKLNHGKMFIKEIAIELGRSHKSVSVKINNLGLYLSSEERSNIRKRINTQPNTIVNKNYCVHCNNEISIKRKFCDMKCKTEYEYNKRINDWINGITSGHRENDIFLRLHAYVRKYIFEKYNNKCCKCGFSGCNSIDGLSILQINHIDGKAENSTESNLELLCPNCHAMTHNYGARNKNSKRKRFKSE